METGLAMERVLGHLNLAMADKVFLRRVHLLRPLELGEALGDNWIIFTPFNGLGLDFNGVDLGLSPSINFVGRLQKLGEESPFDVIREKSIKLFEALKDFYAL